LQNLYFPARELTPYAEYVEADDLTVGKVYFDVTFLDKQMLVPELRPLVFVGRDLSRKTTAFCISKTPRAIWRALATAPRRAT
jgi:hypothetical protein